MTLTPFLTAPLHIQMHAVAALLAIGLGPVALYRTRRDALHKWIGRTWVAAMAVTALSSFLIWNFGLIGPFSPIHLLSVLALWSLWQGLAYIRRGNPAAHAAVFRSLYWRGLCVAGLFNFLPGRTMNRSLLPDMPEAGYGVIALGLTVLLAQWYLQRRGGPHPHPACSARTAVMRVFPLHKGQALRYRARHQVKTVRSWRNW